MNPRDKVMIQALKRYNNLLNTEAASSGYFPMTGSHVNITCSL